MKRASKNVSRLQAQLNHARLANAGTNRQSILSQAGQLFLRLIDRQSSSTRAQLIGYRKGLPGRSRLRVIALCDPPGDMAKRAPEGLFVERNAQPDSAMALFNSPFGPEVLVTTDFLSEGVDLHRCCRHLVHYELDPSPLRVIQREGRIRRIESWAFRCGRPVRVATPAWGGTRDQRLVEVVGNRLKQFDMLLGGVNQPVDDDLGQEAMDDQSAIIALVQARLPRLSLKPKLRMRKASK